ncbi:enoyl-CoA hydratase/isomerase family protein [Paraglaciecola aquimarina]|uniref:3-hydroxyisobutyryl-CoA hydrolase n=1 Tax=Paraglaciecola algarum TaxID=3050085 RepID=A0ABS9D7L6_9ALTE|nr:enoyl-CoA hydratase/isomerase family protein [Paraglaciecola sp. G1-23]
MLGVTFQILQTRDRAKIGYASLNKPKAFNAIDEQMIVSLKSTLEAWQSDPEIIMVLIDGAGDKAFCAGGDIVAMYHAMQVSNKLKLSQTNSLQSFFTQEYQLDHLIHTFTKPILMWGNGLVMGGGLGLLSGASHKVVTENSRLAMPEINIGLYPDAGASYFLNKMPAGSGLLLGLTGMSINAADALYTGLADFFISHESKYKLIEKLKSTEWLGQDAAHTLTDICQNLQNQHIPQLPKHQLKPHQDWLIELTQTQDVEEATQFILAKNQQYDWLTQGMTNLQKGSPLSAHLVFHQLQISNAFDLAECFKMELNMSCKCAEYGEFQEGVRALLIDKDHQPKWKFNTLAGVTKSTVDWFFESIWDESDHPLAGLGN